MGSRPREARRRLVWAVMASVLGGQRSPEGERKRVFAWWSLVVSRVSTKTVHLTVTIIKETVGLKQGAIARPLCMH